MARAALLQLAGLLLAAPLAQAQQATVQVPLQFGRLAAAGAGSVTLAPSGARQAGGSVVLLASPAAPAQLTLLDDGSGKAWTVTLPPDSAVQLSNGNATMALRRFTSSHDGVLNSGRTVLIGATLDVAASQPRGQYSGSFQVSIDYQ